MKKESEYKKGLKKTEDKTVSNTVFNTKIIAKVREANDIVDVISEHIKLEQKGKEMVGLCPFHNDHEPSLSVNGDKQIFKCFSCGAGGDVFEFIEKYENITFPQAIKRLAKRANIKLKGNWEERFAIFRENIESFPVIAETLAEQLGVSVTPLNQIKIGFYPLEQAWVFPERDASGKITALLKRLPKRYRNKDKYVEDGGKRGLYYQHPLPDSDETVYVCEGISDTLYALNMGYVAVGKPNAGTGNSILAKLLKDRNVVIVGDNDEPGRKGMEETFETLKPVCRSVVKILPPTEGDDLRKWHPTVDEFEAHIRKHGKKESDSKILTTSLPRPLVEKWLDETQIKNEQRLIHNFHQVWYRHNGSHYEEIEEGHLDEDIYSYFDDCKMSTPTKSGQIICPFPLDDRFVKKFKHALAAKCHLTVPNGVFEPFYINSKQQVDLTQAIVFKNGIYHVLENRFEELSPDIFITSALPYNFNLNSNCPLWLWFVEDIFSGDEECIALLQEWLGYNLIASNHMEQMMFFFGVPGSGKSTTADVLEALLGPDRYYAADIEQFTARFGLECLIGKYALIINDDSEIDKRKLNKILNRFKRITGQDTMNINRRYRTSINIKPTWRITYVGNTMPEFSDEPQALLRRLNLLYFPNNYYQAKDGPDRTLKNRLAKEAQGIAIWAIEGLRRLLENDYFTQPKASKKHLELFKELSNPVRTMVEEHCQIYKGYEVTQHYTLVQDLYDFYKVWSQVDRGNKPLTKESFCINFHSAFGNQFEKKRKWIGDKRTYVYMGIEILPKSREEYLGGLKWNV